jgi:hypothetical protein
MKKSSLRRLAFFLSAIVCLALASACSPDRWPYFGPQPTPTAQVLFIGNSYTYYNGGIDKELNRLAPSIGTQSITAGGFTLKDHWEKGDAAAAIRAGGWNYVVLQEQSLLPVLNWDMFNTYARLFDAEIRAVGARTVLLMTWERPDSAAEGVTTANLANGYYAVGNGLGALVVPAGVAFSHSLLLRPDLALNIQDGHPTAAGTYLAACVVYAVILQKSPVGNSYTGNGLSQAEGLFLQQVAAETTGY